MAKKESTGSDEVQKKVDEAEEQGFIGVGVDPIPNSEYSLESGPDSPTVLEQQKALAEKQSKEGTGPFATRT